MPARLALASAGFEIDGAWLVRGISLSLDPGRLTAVIGPNGSGKSTVLRLLAGLWRPTEGAANLGGRSLADIARKELAREVTFVPQETRLDFAFSVRDVVAMGRHPHLGRFGREGPADQTAISEALERADVADLAARPANELSGGEKQRVLLARALATQARIILLDEPTANLDVDHALEILDLCRCLCADGKAIAIAMHDLNGVWRSADRAALLHHGQLKALNEPAAVLTPETIREVFGVHAEQVVSASGETVLVFHRDDSKAVH